MLWQEQHKMVDSNLSLSDSELDFTDGAHIKLDTLPRHSHFFNSPISNNTNSNSSRLSVSMPINIHIDGRIDAHDSIVTKRREQYRQVQEDEELYSFDNRLGLAHDLGFLATMPELCDVTFLVGEDRQPVCGVRAILAARSK